MCKDVGVLFPVHKFIFQFRVATPDRSKRRKAFSYFYLGSFLVANKLEKYGPSLIHIKIA